MVHDATDNRIDRLLAGEFERVLTSYRAGGSTPASVRSYRESAARLIAHLRDDLGREPHISDFTLDEVEEYLAKCADDVRDGRLAKESYRSHCRRLRALSKRMHERGQIESHRLATLKTPRVKEGEDRPVVPSQSDVLAVLRATDPATTTGRLERALVSLLSDCGVRRSEVEAFDVADVDFDLNVVKVRRPAKDSACRSVPFGEATRAALLSYLGHRRQGPLFLDRGARRMSARSILRHVVQAGTRAGLLIRLGPQRLRRFAATRLATLGASQPVLFAIMGWHPDPRRNAFPRYIVLDDEELAMVSPALSPVDHLDW